MSEDKLKKEEDDAVLGDTEKDFSPAEQDEFDKLAQNDPSEDSGDASDQVGKGFRKEPAKAGFRNALSNVRSYRKLGITMGLVSIIVAFVVAFFAFLLPFKLHNIIQSIEQRVGNVPSYAVERRLEFYMSRYLMIRALESTGDFDFSEGGADRNRFTYLGDGFWKTMYTNWRGAQLENVLSTKYGIKIRADVNPEIFRRSSKVRADQFRIEHTGVSKESRLRNQTLDRTEVRDFIKQFAREETRSLQVFKRHNMRKVMKRYYGVGKWRLFEDKIDKTKNSYYEKKRAVQKRLVNETVGRLSERYALYMECLLGGSTSRSCRDTLKRADPDTGLPDPDSESDGRKQTDELVDELTPENGSDRSVRKRISKAISEQVQEFGLKKVLAVIAGPLAVIDFVDTFSHIENSLSSGTLNAVVYDKNAQQYMAFAAPILSGDSQILSGEVDIEEVRVAHEIFDGFEESPVYQAGIPNYGSVNAAGGIHRDCDGDESNGKETLLDPGETVCPDKRLVQNKTSFTDSPTWSGLHTIFAGYRSGPIDDVLSFVNDVIGGLVDITGLDSVIQKISEISGFNDVMAKAFAALLNRIAGSVATGAEVGGEAYENMYAAIAVQQSAVGGEVGVAKEDTIGGGYLTDRKVTEIRNEQLEDYYQELEQKSFFARYFSPSVKESLTGRVAMHMPSSVGATSQQVASALLNPFKIFGSVGRSFSARTSAATVPETNPFHVINMGFAPSEPIFTANEGEGMNPDEVNAQYRCDLPVAERPQNKAFGQPEGIPFDVPLLADPCLLEQAVLDASTRYFDASFDEGISGGAAGSTSTTAGASVVGDPTTESASVQCAPGTKDLGVKPSHNDGVAISARLCAIPTIPSSSNESQPGTLFSVPGADGKLIVNSRVSGAVLAMSQAAQSDGVSFKADSGWRSYEHQEALWYQYGQDTALAARPGYSNHEAGAAIDFDLDASANKNATCANRATDPGDPQWEWLKANAARFGFGQYAVEPWHWDATTSANICR